MLKKLRLRFILINMVIITAMLFVIFGLVFYFTRANLRTESISMMQNLASAPAGPGRPNEPPEKVRLPYFTVQTGPFGKLTATGSGFFDLSDEALLTELTETALASAEPIGEIEEYNLRFCCFAGPRGRSVVFADTSGEAAALSSLARTCSLIGAVSFVVFLGISIFLAHWAVRPVEKAWTQQKQFVADASHELKTPLTVIMTNAELLQSPDCGEQGRYSSTDSILIMSKQMRSLIEQLLELARSDSGQSEISLSRLDLSGITSRVLLTFEPVFYERGLSFESSIEDNIFVKGSEESLKRLLDILLDNARKYASDGGAVTVSLSAVGRSRCRLTVANTGQPISREDLTNIFRRFYRGDKARSRDGGFGLGLSIADNIVSLHHGKLWAESRDGVNSFHVELQTC